MLLQLLFKVFFVPKCIKIMFFLFLKNYFWNQYIKTIQNKKNNYFLTKKYLIFLKSQVELYF
jgi:hypothetical protein